MSTQYLQPILNIYSIDVHTISTQEEVEGLQWGRPGPGGAYWRHSALTGQNFFDKMVSIVAEAILQLGDEGPTIHVSVLCS